MLRKLKYFFIRNYNLLFHDKKCFRLTLHKPHKLELGDILTEGSVHFENIGKGWFKLII